MSLKVENISKRFGPVRANHEISMLVEPGTIHAVLGENGAGKSTLMKILSGFQDADSGTVMLDGSPIPLGDPRGAIAAGVGMLHQDPLVALPFTVIENFVLGSSLTRADARRHLLEAKERLGFNLPADEVTRSLSVGERQQLEIVRLLALGVRVLILDEPTSGISTGQRDLLFRALRTLAADGLIVLFVSHKLEEILEICDSVTVIRAGEVVGERLLPATPNQLIEMMFEGEITPRGRQAIDLGTETFIIEDLTATDLRQSIEGVAFTMARGEVIGIAGLEGSGQRPLMRALAGLVKAHRGSLTLHGSEMSGNHRSFLRSGIHYLPAGRLEEGLFPGLTIAEHLELALGEDSIDWDSSQVRAEQAIHHLKIKGRHDDHVDGLSGGNQQRVLLAMIPETVHVLLMEHPTRGLDIESADLIWGQLLERRSGGTSIVFVSADLDELVTYADRIAVCFNGRVLDVVDAQQVSALELGSLIGGQAISR